MNKKPKRRKVETDPDEHWAKWLTIGIEFIVVVMSFTAVGFLLDQLDDTLPGFMVMGFLAGFGLMMYLILKRSGYFDQWLNK